MVFQFFFQAALGVALAVAAAGLLFLLVYGLVFAGRSGRR